MVELVYTTKYILSLPFHGILIDGTRGCVGMVDEEDLKSFERNARAGSSPASPTIYKEILWKHVQDAKEILSL